MHVVERNTSDAKESVRTVHSCRPPQQKHGVQRTTEYATGARRFRLRACDFWQPFVLQQQLLKPIWQHCALLSGNGQAFLAEPSAQPRLSSKMLR